MVYFLGWIYTISYKENIALVFIQFSFDYFNTKTVLPSVFQSCLYVIWCGGGKVTFVDGDVCACVCVCGTMGAVKPFFSPMVMCGLTFWKLVKMLKIAPAHTTQQRLAVFKSIVCVVLLKWRVRKTQSVWLVMIKACFNGASRAVPRHVGWGSKVNCQHSG